VTFEKTEYAGLPNKFEAGTPNIAGAVGLGAAIDYVVAQGFENFVPHEEQLLTYATRRLGEIPGLRIIGTAKRKAGVISFVMEEPAVSPMDVGTQLDLEGIAVRTGHHCCQPVMDRFKIGATTRASLAMYNTREDVDALVAALVKVRAKGLAKGPPVGGVVSEGVKYPAASAASVSAAADELAEIFDLLGDRDARNQHILELGEKIPAMPAALKVDANRVHGCMSTVHLAGRTNGEGRLDFVADSDAHIVRGLIGVLQELFAGQRTTEILAFDIEAFFHRIGVEQFITVQRRSGLAGMVKRIRDLARENHFSHG
jgi:cysteine desulfurase/selenocysteine lyase